MKSFLKACVTTIVLLLSKVYLFLDTVYEFAYACVLIAEASFVWIFSDTLGFSSLKSSPVEFVAFDDQLLPLPEKTSLLLTTLGVKRIVSSSGKELGDASSGDHVAHSSEMSNRVQAFFCKGVSRNTVVLPPGILGDRLYYSEVIPVLGNSPLCVLAGIYSFTHKQARFGK